MPAILKAKDPKHAFVYSHVGSITDNPSGGAYSYRASQATLNTTGKSMTMDSKEKSVVVLLLRPAFVINGLDRPDRDEEKIPGSSDAEGGSRKALEGRQK